MLRAVVKSFDGARLVRALDPKSVVASEWANRHADSFASSDFDALKKEIWEAGGNVQPIKVRPLNRSTHVTLAAPEFEIVFGHRRHQACLELGILVNALIEEIDDQKLFIEMERENRGRKNLSPWEQGGMYQSALEKGLYPSQRKLSEAIGVDLSLISKSIGLAKLPLEMIEAFRSPLDIQFRWAQPLGEALQKDPRGVLSRANEIKARRLQEDLSANAVLLRLLGDEQSQNGGKGHHDFLIDGKKVGSLTIDGQGGVSLKIRGGVLSAEQHKALINAIASVLKTT